MNKTIHKKLSLNKDTLRKLSNDEANQVQGGIGTRLCTGDICNRETELRNCLSTNWPKGNAC